MADPDPAPPPQAEVKSWPNALQQLWRDLLPSGLVPGQGGLLPRWGDQDPAPPPQAEVESWPSALQQFWRDMLPEGRVPGQGGLVPPPYERPLWLDHPAMETAAAVGHAQRAHDQQMARVDRAEERAARLAQMSLALLALALTLGGFELGWIRDASGGVLYLLALPVALAIATLGLAGIESFEIDRVGMMSFAAPDDLRYETNANRAIVGTEERGRSRAAWTAGNKLDQLLQARAWFSRGLVLLILSALVGIGLQFATPAQPADARMHMSPGCQATTRSCAPNAQTPKGAAGTAMTAARLSLRGITIKTSSVPYG